MTQLVYVNEALEELGLDQTDYDEFIVDLKSFLDEMIPELEAVVLARDFIEIRAKAHALKGALANLRFVAASKVAQKLESQARDGLLDHLDENMAELKSVLAESFVEIGV